MIHNDSENKLSLKKIVPILTKKLGLSLSFYSRTFTLLSLGHASGIIRGVATTYLMALWLPQEVFGQFRYVLAIFVLAGVFSLNGLNAAVIRGTAIGQAAIAWVAMKRIAVFSLLGSGFLLLAGLERLWKGEPSIFYGLLFAATVFPLYSICGLYGPILTGQERIRSLTRIAIINNILFATLFVLVIFFSKQLLQLLVAYFSIDVVIRGYFTWKSLRPLPRIGEVKEHLRLGDHLSAIGFIQALSAQLDQILIQRFAGYGVLANYAVATLIPEQIKDFVNSLSGIVLRRFSQYQKHASTERAIKKHFWLMLTFSCVVVLTYAIAAFLFFPVLFPAYRHETLPSMVYAIGLLAMPALVGLNYFQAFHRLRALWIFHLTGSFFQITFNLLLIPTFGSWGAIWSKTLTRLLGLGLAYPRSFSPKDSTHPRSIRDETL